MRKYKTLLIKEELHSKLEELRKYLGYKTYPEVIQHLLKLENYVK